MIDAIDVVDVIAVIAAVAAVVVMVAAADRCIDVVFDDFHLLLHFHDHVFYDDHEKFLLLFFQ